MNVVQRSLTILLLLALGSPQAFAFLEIGDEAPPLHLAEWIQGDAVDLKRDAGKRIHMIEFWAVWCPPCKESVPRLSRIQNKYGDKLTIVGVTAPDLRGNSPSAIRRFVKDQGSDMSYRVAIDDREKTTESYMVAARAMGIPHAFLVDKKGQIAWQGSPLEPGLEDVIDRLIKGSYDPKVEAEVSRRFDELDVAFRRGQWDAVTTGLKDILALSPSNEVALRALKRIYVDELDKMDEFRNWAKSYQQKYADNARSLEALTAIMLESWDLFLSDPELVLQTAQAAYKASSPPEPTVTVLYAQVLYQIGAIERAIDLQREAMEALSGPVRNEAKQVYDFYNRCKELKSRLQ